VFFFGLGAFPYGSEGTIVGSVTGTVMAIFGVKLMWPPGQQLPFKVDWSYFKRFEVNILFNAFFFL